MPASSLVFDSEEPAGDHPITRASRQLSRVMAFKRLTAILNGVCGYPPNFLRLARADRDAWALNHPVGRILVLGPGNDEIAALRRAIRVFAGMRPNPEGVQVPYFEDMPEGVFLPYRPTHAVDALDVAEGRGPEGEHMLDDPDLMRSIVAVYACDVGMHIAGPQEIADYLGPAILESGEFGVPIVTVDFAMPSAVNSLIVCDYDVPDFTITVVDEEGEAEQRVVYRGGSSLETMSHTYEKEGVVWVSHRAGPSGTYYHHPLSYGLTNCLTAPIALVGDLHGYAVPGSYQSDIVRQREGYIVRVGRFKVINPAMAVPLTYKATPNKYELVRMYACPPLIQALGPIATKLNPRDPASQGAFTASAMKLTENYLPLRKFKMMGEDVDSPERSMTLFRRLTTERSMELAFESIPRPTLPSSKVARRAAENATRDHIVDRTGCNVEVADAFARVSLPMSLGELVIEVVAVCRAGMTFVANALYQAFQALAVKWAAFRGVDGVPNNLLFAALRLFRTATGNVNWAKNAATKIRSWLGEPYEAHIQSAREALRNNSEASHVLGIVLDVTLAVGFATAEELIRGGSMRASAAMAVLELTVVLTDEILSYYHNHHRLGYSEVAWLEFKSKVATAALSAANHMFYALMPVPMAIISHALWNYYLQRRVSGPIDKRISAFLAAEQSALLSMKDEIDMMQVVPGAEMMDKKALGPSPFVMVQAIGEESPFDAEAASAMEQEYAVSARRTAETHTVFLDSEGLRGAFGRPTNSPHDVHSLGVMRLAKPVPTVDPGEWVAARAMNRKCVDESNDVVVVLTYEELMDYFMARKEWSLEKRQAWARRLLELTDGVDTSQGKLHIKKDEWLRMKALYDASFGEYRYLKPRPLMAGDNPLEFALFVPMAELYGGDYVQLFSFAENRFLAMEYAIAMEYLRQATTWHAVLIYFKSPLPQLISEANSIITMPSVLWGVELHGDDNFTAYKGCIWPRADWGCVAGYALQMYNGCDLASCDLTTREEAHEGLAEWSTSVADVPETAYSICVTVQHGAARERTIDLDDQPNVKVLWRHELSTDTGRASTSFTAMSVGRFAWMKSITLVRERWPTWCRRTATEGYIHPSGLIFDLCLESYRLLGFEAIPEVPNGTTHPGVPSFLGGHSHYATSHDFVAGQAAVHAGAGALQQAVLQDAVKFFSMWAMIPRDAVGTVWCPEPTVKMCLMPILHRDPVVNLVFNAHVKTLDKGVMANPISRHVALTAVRSLALQGLEYCNIDDMTKKEMWRSWAQYVSRHEYYKKEIMSGAIYEDVSEDCYLNTVASFDLAHGTAVLNTMREALTEDVYSYEAMLGCLQSSVDLVALYPFRSL